MQGKKVVKGKEKPKEDKMRPTDEELKDAICEVLKEVDFNTVRIQSQLNLIVVIYMCYCNTPYIHDTMLLCFMLNNAE